MIKMIPRDKTGLKSTLCLFCSLKEDETLDSNKYYNATGALSFTISTQLCKYLHIICTVSTDGWLCGTMTGGLLVSADDWSKAWCRRMAAGGWRWVALVRHCDRSLHWPVVQSGGGQHGGHCTCSPGPGPHLPRPWGPALAPPPWTPRTRPPASTQSQVARQLYFTSLCHDLLDWSLQFKSTV